ncbi:cytochrome P450 [Amycolatopsis albispora]|uniref:Cytochrome P450 n=1 Tax=Amycolatopsis albispora TaxID=1804986 RepID=A0A344L5G5_9PSEU|nr:cytochrome P450 [Amycolatopsis albispora]AXB43289.1 hypothetical protein A4R43_12595 [Amycolatopsis albispora]
MAESILSADTGLDAVRALYDWGTYQRATEPVIFDAGSGAWHVFSFEEAERVFTDRKIFSSEFPREVSVNDDLIEGNLALTDPPRHTELRGLVSKRFTARAITELRDEIDTIITGLLDNLSGDTGIDFVDEFSYRLPASVIAHVLGLPRADVPLFKRWSFAQLSEQRTQAVEAEGQHDVARSVLAEMREYFAEQVRDRRANPRDDLITALAHAEIHGVRLSDEELIGFLRLLLTGGDMTTCSLITSAVLCFDGRAGLLDRLREDPGLIPAAVEEVARYRPPFARVARWTTAETELGGVRVPAGQVVLPWLTSANRDERKFADAEEFRVDRHPNPHLSFGRGVHFCLGVHLSKLEAQRALAQLAARFEDIAVRTDEPLRHFDPAGGVLALAALPVDFRARSSSRP